MSVRILHDHDQNLAALYCSTSDVAFGPVFYDSDDSKHGPEDRARAFLRWLPQDARRYDHAELETKYSEWLAQEATQWAENDAEEAADSPADPVSVKANGELE